MKEDREVFQVDLDPFMGVKKKLRVWKRVARAPAARAGPVKPE